MAKARDIPGLTADTPFAEAAARTVAVRTEELFDAADNVLDIDDIEAVHDMRVASRRLRAVLEIYEKCFPKKLHREVLRDVKGLADALGARRDPDVQLERLKDIPFGEPSALEAFSVELRAEQIAGNAHLADALAEAGERDLRGRLIELGEAAA
jgi:CHAD domain-containing protein